jgi:endoglucanase
VSRPRGGDASDGIPGEPCGRWGGDLSTAGDFPVRLNVAGRLISSPHEYRTSVSRRSWFDDPSRPGEHARIWNRLWDHLYVENIAPITMGELGTAPAPRRRPDPAP